MLVSDVLSKNYAIFCFKDFKTTAITFKYETDYPKEKLIKLVKEKPWSVDSAEYSHDAESADEDFEENEVEQALVKIPSKEEKTRLEIAEDS